ncbi:MAG: lytic transglycosylase domain-containing protein [Bryobacteraceae bacterium]
MRLLLVLLAAAGAGGAAEYAVLASGARLRIDRHEPAGEKVRLYSGAGFTEMDAGQVIHFESEDYVAPAVAPQKVEPQAAPAAPRNLVDAAAEKYGLPKSFLHSVVRQESGYRANAISPKGAIGLMQLMPGTARMYGADPTDPAQNLDAGARHLAELLMKYNGGVWRALAAYNAGQGAVARYGAVPPYRETREYIRRIMESWKKQP